MRAHVKECIGRAGQARAGAGQGRRGALTCPSIPFLPTDTKLGSYWYTMVTFVPVGKNGVVRVRERDIATLTLHCVLVSWLISSYLLIPLCPAALDSDATFSMVGCYGDNEDRMLAVHVGDVGAPWECAIRADGRGYSIFALQYGGQCWLGNDLARATQLGTTSNCNEFMCAGDRSQMCGGGYANVLYVLEGKQSWASPLCPSAFHFAQGDLPMLHQVALFPQIMIWSHSHGYWLLQGLLPLICVHSPYRCALPFVDTRLVPVT